MTQDPRSHRQRCKAHLTTDKTKPCGNFAVHGATVCIAHGARSPKARVKARVRAEVMNWTLGEAVDDPAVTLLRLITQSRMRADAYALELQQLAGDGSDLIAAFTGSAYGEGGLQGEYIRSIVILEAEERDRCARFCKIAIDAGLAERMVRVAEQQAATVAAAVQAAVAELELPDATRRAVIAGVAGQLRLVAG